MDYFTADGHALDADQVDGELRRHAGQLHRRRGRRRPAGLRLGRAVHLRERGRRTGASRSRTSYINDAGWENYGESIATKAENIEPYRDCLEKLVPIIQQSSVDYLADPAETNG